MSSVETGQMSAVETGQMSAAETGQMSAVETRQMSSILVKRPGRAPASPHRDLRPRICRKPLFFLSKMQIWEHSGAAGMPSAAPEMAPSTAGRSLTQRAGGQDYVSSEQTPSNYSCAIHVGQTLLI